MEVNMYYHASQVGGIKQLEPRISNHGVPLIYFSKKRENVLVYLSNAIEKYCKETGRDLKIELEVRNEDEIKQALEVGVDRIMLDNFTPERTREAVKMINGAVEIESSGGITFDTLRAYGECGVDFISVGALTHSVKGLDMSFKAC
jgi:nicotinate-nucleotide pyrophosphorylase